MTDAASPPGRAAATGLDLRRALMAELRAAEAAFTTLAPDRALHAGRVRLKRARALARIAIHAAPWTARRLNRGAREIMRSLSAARDLDALIAVADAMAAAKTKRVRIGMAQVAAALKARRAGLGRPHLADAAHDVRGLLALAKALPMLDNDDITHGLARLDARARRGFRRAQRSLEAQARHWWRKREKDRLFAHDVTEMARTAHRAAQKRGRCCAKLCDLLGRERDTTLLLALVNANPAMIAKNRHRKAVRKTLTQTIAWLSARADRRGRKHYGSA